MSLLPTATFAAPGIPYYQPFGSGGGGSTVSTFTTASISSLTVSTINGVPPENFDTADWALFPAVGTVDLDSNNISGVGTISGAGANFTLEAGTGNNINVEGGNVNVEAIDNAGGIYFAIDNTNVGAFTNTGFSAPIINTSSIATSTITANTIFALSTINVISTISSLNIVADTATISSVNVSSVIGNSASISSVLTSSIVGNSGSFSNAQLSTINGYNYNNPVVSTITAGDVSCSTINGNELIISTIVLESTIQASGGSFSNLSAQAFSTIGAEIKQGLMSSIVINPQINADFSVDLGMGNFLTTLGTGLFGVAVAVPTTVGTLTYGITKGLASLFEPKPNLTNIAVTSNQFEVYNYASQLQISTLGNQVSTIYSFLSTIPSTVVVNNSNTFSTVSEIQLPFFFSTISQSANPTCIRAIADPTQTVSTPYTYEQSLPDYSWVEIPSLGNNISTLSLSTLQLAPSTIIKGDIEGAVMEVLEAGSLTDYGEIKTAGYWVTQGTTDPNYGIYVRNSANEPAWINSNFSTFTIAYESKPPLQFYVSPAGDDGYATGSINNPYKTIQAAITAAEAISSGTNQALVTVAPGQYNENLTFNKGYVTVMGDLNTQDGNQITSLNGDITVNCGFSDDLVARQVILQGLQIDGRLNDTSPNQHTLIIQDCKFFDTDTMINVNPTAADQRTFITNSEFVQTGTSTQPCLQFNVGQVQLERVDIDNSTNNTILLLVSGTATMARCNFGNFESGTTETGTTVAPIVSVNSTSAGVHTFGFTNIYYTSASNKTGTANATGILFTTNLTMTAIVLNCVFTLTGTSDLAGQFIMKPFGAGVVTLLQADNQSSPAAAGSATLISPAFVRADYVIPSITNGSISSVTMRASTITTNTVNTNTLSTLNLQTSTITVSTLSVNNLIDFGKTSFPNTSFMVGGASNSAILNTAFQAAPYTSVLTFYKGFTNDIAPAGYICMAADVGSIGVSKIPDAAITLDVGGLLCASNISSPQISTTQLGASSANISSIKQAINTEAVPYVRCPLTVTQNFDYYGSSYGHFNGTQSVVGGYFLTLSNSIGGGHSEADFIFPPPGLSSMMTCQATYFKTNSNAPQSPTWIGNQTIGANGQISTIQVFGDDNVDVYVSYIGFV